MRKLSAVLCALAPFLAVPASAQDVSVTSATTVSEQRVDRSNAQQSEQSDACSAESLPRAEQRRIADEYLRREQADGKASADIWVREEGLRYRMFLVDQGICPPPTDAELAAVEEWREQNRRQAVAAAPSEDSEGGCTMRMVPIAGLGGAMTMGMVPDCD